MPNIYDITNEDLDLIIRTLDKMQPIYSSDDDIHKHTRTLGAECKKIIALDDKYQISNNIVALNFDDAYTQIQRHSQDPRIIQVLNTIKSSDGIEPETQLNVKDLFVRVWNLANHQLATEDTILLIIDNLQHNIIAKGGCLAGISARLTMPYCQFIRDIEEKAQKLKPIIQTSTETSRSTNHNDNLLQNLSEEEQLQLALQASLELEEQVRRQANIELHKQQEIAKTEASIQEEDEKQLQLALQASLSSMTNNKSPLTFNSNNTQASSSSVLHLTEEEKIKAALQASIKSGDEATQRRLYENVLTHEERQVAYGMYWLSNGMERNRNRNWRPAEKKDAPADWKAPEDIVRDIIARRHNNR